MPKDPCRTCRFFVPTPEARAAHGKARAANLPVDGGECRRHPPQPSLLHTVFPIIVAPDSTGCGEWSRPVPSP